MATIRSSGASQSTIKLVATNLIASGKLAGEHDRSNDEGKLRGWRFLWLVI